MLSKKGKIMRKGLFYIGLVGILMLANQTFCMERTHDLNTLYLNYLDIGEAYELPNITYDEVVALWLKMGIERSEPANAQAYAGFYELVQNWVQEGLDFELNNEWLVWRGEQPTAQGLRLILFIQEPVGQRANEVLQALLNKIDIYRNITGDPQAYQDFYNSVRGQLNSRQGKMILDAVAARIAEIPFKPQAELLQLIVEISDYRNGSDDQRAYQQLERTVRNELRKIELKDKLDYLIIEDIKEKEKVHTNIAHIFEYRGISEDQGAYAGLFGQLIIKLATMLSLVPIDDNKLRQLELCPPFKGLHMPPRVKVMQDGKWEPAYLKTMDLPCMQQYTPPQKEDDGNMRVVMQLRSVNQSKLPGLRGGFCSGLSIRNGILIHQYAKNEDERLLQALYDQEAAAAFLNQVGCQPRVEKVALDNLIATKEIPGLQAADVTVIKSPIVFDSRFQFYFDEHELREMEAVKRRIQEGLARENFFHFFVVGNLDERLTAETPEHYFVFIVLKEGKTIQYIVLDTVADYHLRADSYEFLRLRYFIDLLEQGKSDLNLIPVE